MYLRGGFENILERRGLSATVVIVANRDRYSEACQCSGWPTCSPYCCPVFFFHLYNLLEIPWKIAICPGRLIPIRKTATCLLTRRSLCPHHESDSVDYSPVRSTRSFLCLSADICSHVSFFAVFESAFRGICHYLHAAINYHASSNPPSSIEPRINLTRSFSKQGYWFRPDISLLCHHYMTTWFNSIITAHQAMFKYVFSPLCLSVNLLPISGLVYCGSVLCDSWQSIIIWQRWCGTSLVWLTDLRYRWYRSRVPGKQRRS